MVATYPSGVSVIAIICSPTLASRPRSCGANGTGAGPDHSGMASLSSSHRYQDGHRPHFQTPERAHTTFIGHSVNSSCRSSSGFMSSARAISPFRPPAPRREPAAQTNTCRPMPTFGYRPSSGGSRFLSCPSKLSRARMSGVLTRMRTLDRCCRLVCRIRRSSIKYKADACNPNEIGGMNEQHALSSSDPIDSS